MQFPDQASRKSDSSSTPLKSLKRTHWHVFIPLLAALLMAVMLPLTSTDILAADIPVSNESELRAAVASSNTIELANSITMATTLTIPAGKEITIDGCGNTLSLNIPGSTITPVINVIGELTLTNITVTHALGSQGDGIWLFDPINNATSGYLLHLKTGTVITGNVNGVYNAAGNNIHGIMTTDMDDGVLITRNTEVGIVNGGTLDLYGGVISDNGDSGIVNGVGGIATMHPAAPGHDATVISGNAVGGVRNSGFFTMEDGLITGHIGNSGVHNVAGTFNMSGGVISGNTATNGGGVYFTAGTFNMSGGVIKDNTATDGGGVDFNSGTFNMSGGVISGNTATNGGGVTFGGSADVFTMSGNAEISGNTSGSDGGGVYTYSDFIMKDDAALKNNTASGDGGGIYRYNATMVSLSGNAEISGNTAGGDGGGIYIKDWSANGYGGLSVEVNVLFADNTAKYFCKGPTDTYSAYYDANILGTHWSAPCPLDEGGVIYNKGFNNCDISCQISPYYYYIFYYANALDATSLSSYTFPIKTGAWKEGTTRTVANFSTIPLSRSGFYLLGWATNPSATTPEYYPGDSYTFSTNASPSNPQDYNLHLYAVWATTPPDYAISYVLNGGTNAPSNPTTYNATSTFPIGIANPTRTNYTFSGWTVTYANTAITAITTPTTAYSIPSGTTGNITLTANWAELYNVTYNANGGNGSMPNGTATYDQAFTLAANTFTRTGYTFTGWNTAANGSGTSYTNRYAFTPWNLTTDLTLYAQWQQNNTPPPASTYTVTYNGNSYNSGTAPVDSNSYSAGDMVTVLGNTGNLVRTGYTFLGWSTRYDATSATYVAGSTFVINSNVTLYAVWQQNSSDPSTTYKVTYNGNGNAGGTAPVDSNSYSAGDMVTVQGNTGNLVRTNYTFLGWATSASGAVAYTSGQSFIINSNVTLYAVWSQNPDTTTFTVKFEDWNKTLLKSEQVRRGGDATAPASPTREDHTFAGWDRAYTNIQSDITVTAQYTKNTAIDSFEPVQKLPSIKLWKLVIPLYPSKVNPNAWSLVSMILTIAGVLLAVITGIRTQVLRGKRTANEAYTLAWLIATIILGIAGIIVFFTTQDMSQLMVLVNYWTIASAVILALEIVGYVITFRRKS